MQTHQIHLSGARQSVHEIRTELFAFPDVLEVFVTGRPDVLVVVHTGRPCPGEWLGALRALGYRTPARGRARWPRLERSELLLRHGVSGNAGADEGDSTTSSAGNEQSPRRRRDAA